MRFPRRDNPFAWPRDVPRPDVPAHPRNALQRRHGNRRAQQIVAAGLETGSAEDRYEWEADRLSRLAMGSPVGSPVGSPPRALETIRRALEAILHAHGATGGAADPAVAQTVARALARSDGQPAPTGIREWLDQVSGAELSGMRVQVDPELLELLELLARILEPPEPEKRTEPEERPAGDLYDDVERRIQAGEEVTDDELDAAVKDLMASLLEGQGYVDGFGEAITSQSVAIIGLTWNQDYQMGPGTLELPTRATVKRDIRIGYFRTAISHEMGHYVRGVGGDGPSDAILSLIAEETAKVFPKPANEDKDVDYWRREELEADLRGIWLRYRSTGHLPADTEIDLGLDQLGPGDASHPPDTVRVALMKKFVRAVKEMVEDQDGNPRKHSAVVG